jgi:FkbM family methyltransferase
MRTLSRAKRAFFSTLHQLRLLDLVRNRMPAAIYRHAAFEGTFTTTITRDATFRMRHYGSALENALYWDGWGSGNEPWSERLWTRLAAEARFIADIGANTGVYALAALAVAPADASIVAVEPVARVFEKLKANIALNGGTIKALEGAASDQNGVAVLYDTPSEHVYSSSLEAAMLGDAATVRSEVATVRLDDYLQREGFPRLDLIKIDVELHEPSVLRGMPRMLQHRPAMLIEVLNPQIGEAILASIDGLGYEIFEIDEHQGPRPTSEPGSRGGAREARNCLFLQPSAAVAHGLRSGSRPTAGVAPEQSAQVKPESKEN